VDLRSFERDASDVAGIELVEKGPVRRHRRFATHLDSEQGNDHLMHGAGRRRRQV
jgi:hypothetical protein